MLDFPYLFALFVRRLPYFIVFTVAGAAIGLALALTLPPTFEAEARLLVESEQIPDELAQSTVRIEASEQLQIIQQRILTRDTLLEMANRLNIYANRRVDGGEALRPDQIVDDLRERIKIVTTGGERRGTVNATLVNVQFSASSPALAALVTNEVVTLMVEENVRIRTGASGETLKFFEQEVLRLDEELSRQGAQIIAFQEANRGALPDSLDFRRGQLVAAQENLSLLMREEAALQERRAALVAMFEATGSVTGADGAAQLTPAQQRLRELEDRLASSSAVLGLDNPRVRILRRQIEAAKEQVAQEAAAATGAGGTSNSESPTMTLFDIQLADIDNQLEFNTARRAEIEVQMEALQATIDATPANVVALDTLQRDYDGTRAQYDRAVASRARAETGDIIEALAKGERISVIENAVLPEEPTSPNRPRVAIAGMAGGIFLSMMLVALLELMNTSIRRSQDIIKQLEVTPLATLPVIRTRGDRVRRRLILLFVVLIVIGTIVGTLWAISTYVMPLDRFWATILERLPQFDLNLPVQ